ncbi:Bestrophin, RFP-TM, chloride channel-domain-containing protein [Baffinella frigidus]|nr:Bestrophin, RFP-TM, chloride channel-domain-containing protein [Cryptophyta sp. CCMP2293]
MSGDVHGAMGKSLEQQGGVTPQDELDAGRGRSASMIAMSAFGTPQSQPSEGKRRTSITMSLFGTANPKNRLIQGLANKVIKARGPILNKSQIWVEPTWCNAFATNKVLPTFQAVELRERDRRRLLAIANRSKQVRGTSIYQEIVLRIKGTMFRLIIGVWLTWVVVLIFIIVRSVRIWEVSMGVQTWFIIIDIADVTSLGVVLSFFLTFYGAEAYSRFKIQWQMGCECESRVINLAILIRASFPDETGHRMLRYMNAAHCLAFSGIGDCAYNDVNFFDHMNTVYKLLTVEELERVRTIGVSGFSFRELVAWVIMIIEAQRKKGALGEIAASEMKLQVLRFRNFFDTIFKHHEQPIPYVYGNFVYTITVVYLLLFSYAVAVNSTDFAATTDKPLGVGSIAFYFLVHFILVFLNAFFVIGLQRLAAQLQNPFGGDFEDIAVLSNVQFKITLS